MKTFSFIFGHTWFWFYFNKFVKLNWLAEPELSPLFNVLFLFSSGSSSLKVNKNFRIIFHPSQTQLNHTKPNSSITNRTHPHQTKLIHTKPNSTAPNRTHPHLTKLIHTNLNSTAPNQTHPYQTKPSQTIPNQIWPTQTGWVCIAEPYPAFPYYLLLCSLLSL